MLSSLKKAIDFERKGYEFYKQEAERALDELARRLLEALAEEELQHIKDIESIHASISEAGDWRELPSRSETVEQKIRRFFEANRERLSQETGDTGSLAVALETELKGYELYDSLARQATDDRERAFFRALMAEENQHYTAIQNVLYYLDHTGDWFQEDESKRWNWMTL